MSEVLQEKLSTTSQFIGTTVNPEYVSLELEAESSFNPNYQGEWLPRLIPNPKYRAFDVSALDQLVSAVGFEFAMKSGAIHFDNILLKTNEDSI